MWARRSDAQHLRNPESSNGLNGRVTPDLGAAQRGGLETRQLTRSDGVSGAGAPRACFGKTGNSKREAAAGL